MPNCLSRCQVYYLLLLHTLFSCLLFLKNSHGGEWSPSWVHSARRPLNGLLYLLRVIMMMENLVEWRLARETEVLGENLPQRQFFHHKSHLTRSGHEPGAAAVGSQRLTAWAMARPQEMILVLNNRISNAFLFTFLYRRYWNKDYPKNSFTVHAIFILFPVAKYNNVMIIIVRTQLYKNCYDFYFAFLSFQGAIYTAVNYRLDNLQWIAVITMPAAV
jgi:hypothetical protein